MILVAAILAWAAFTLGPSVSRIGSGDCTALLFLGAGVATLLAHEPLHGLAMMLTGVPRSKIDLGFFSTNCSVWMPWRRYVLMLLAPLTVSLLGLIATLCTGDWFFLGAAAAAPASAIDVAELGLMSRIKPGRRAFATTRQESETFASGCNPEMQSSKSGFWFLDAACAVSR